MGFQYLILAIFVTFNINLTFSMDTRSAMLGQIQEMEQKLNKQNIKHIKFIALLNQTEEELIHRSIQFSVNYMLKHEYEDSCKFITSNFIKRGISQELITNILKKATCIFKIFKGAAYNKFEEIKQILLQNPNLDVNFKLIVLESSPLHCAACLNNYEATKILINYSNINIDGRCVTNITPLHLAIKPQIDLIDPALDSKHRIRCGDLAKRIITKERFNLVKLLLQAGANTSTLDDNRDTVLVRAEKQSKYYLNRYSDALDSAKFDLSQEYLSKVNLYNESIELIKNFEALKHRAFELIKNKDFDGLKQLATRITFYIKDNNGNTLLHLAIEQQNPQIIKLIVSAVPELLLSKNKSSTTSLDLALRRPRILAYIFPAFENHLKEANVNNLKN